MCNRGELQTLNVEMQSRGAAVDQAVLTDSALDINLTNPVSRPGGAGFRLGKKDIEMSGYYEKE